ncbi:ATP-dependent DNA/RNA helicase/ superfamily II [Synechococcus sp. SYN20]|nr:ATP-dependent DNA/RNA helicase/ superfamily II [Synechococcus sp. SYN20]
MHWQLSGEPEVPGEAPGASPKLQAIEDYNREDCESTALLHDWLLKFRREQGLPEQPLQLPLNDADQEPREPQQSELLSQQLLEEIPDHLADERALGPRGMSWQAHRLLAQLLPFHHREAKVGWWAYFDRRSKAELSPADLIDDGEAIAGAQWVGMDERPSARTGADIHHFRFDPSQPLKLHAGDGDGRLTVELPATDLKLDVDALDAERGTLSLQPQQ